MALSGSNSYDFSGYSLIIEWSAAQDFNANISKVTAKLYLKSNSSSYYISSTKSRTVTITIDGNRDTYSASAQLSGNQKKLLATKVYDVQHATDGKKTLNVTGTFDLSGISLSSKDWGVVSVSDSETLNTIPRASTISSALSWKAPRAFAISIDKASSSFRHTLKLYVKRKTVSTWTYIKSWTDIDTYVSGGFETAEMQKVFQTLNTDSSGHVRIIIETYNGSTLVGSNDYDDASGTFAMGEVVVEYSSKLTYPNQANFNVGSSVHFDISRNYWTYTHKITIKVGDTVVHTSPVVDYSYDWIPTDAETKTIYDLTKTSSSIATTITIQTLYEGVQVDKLKDQGGTAYIVNSEPTFGTGYSYKDSNAAIVAITNNDQQIVRNASTLQVTIPSAAKALPKNSASIVRYDVTVNGVTKSVAYSDSDIVFDFGTVNAESNQTLTVTAVDSRGFSTQTSKTVTMIAYKAPSLAATVRRANGYDVATLINVSGSFVSVSGKNTVSTTSGAQYRYKENVATASFPTAWTNIPVTLNGLTFSSSTISVNLDQAKSFVFEVRVTDKFGTTTVTKIVTIGVPTMFIDDRFSSIGIGMFPNRSNALTVKGEISSYSPTDATKEVFLGWLNSVARLRIGGSTAGFEIQGTGDIPMLKLQNAQTLEVKDGTLLLNGKDVERTLEMDWQEPTWNNQWKTYFGGAFCKTKDGVVMFQGMAQGAVAKDGTGAQVDTIIANLPANCRPIATNLVFFCNTRGGVVVRVDVNTNGDVVFKGGTESGTYLSYLNLSNISFLVH